MQQKKYNLNASNLLISIKDLKEISDEVIELINILDLKDPSKGSIGSWSLREIEKAVKLYKSDIIISATMGDIFDNNEFLKQLEKFDKLNLNFIKFGLLSHSDELLFEKIKLISLRNYITDLVCVIFVDRENNLKLISKKISFFKDSGISCILLDTFEKENGDIFDFCQIKSLKNFILNCKERNLKIGMAGGIKENQIPNMLGISPNIIGLRSAVCENKKRCSSINIQKLKKISQHFNVFNNKAKDKAGA